MTTKSIIILYLLVCISFIAKGQTNVSIESLLQSEKITGAVWSIVANDSIITFGSGIKNINTGEKIKPTDKVHIGSISKTILALGILKLATEGKLKIDEQVKAYLPDLPIVNAWESTNPVTIRHLLDHTSGLGDLRLWHFFSTSSTPTTPLSDFYSRSPEVLTIQARPGNTFSYSNMGYTILGLIIEKISGQPYEAYLDKHLLRPIGMQNSTFQFTSQVEKYYDKDLAMGHFSDGSIAPALPIYLRPAGQFSTTAQDMGILIKFILSRGNLKGQQLIDSIYFQNYGKPNYTFAFKNGLKNGYALGISARDRHGVIGLAHSGNIIGYRAMLYIFPDEKKGFFISHNMDSETANYEVFNQHLITELNIPKHKTKAPIYLNPKDFIEWEGYYVPKITKVEPLRLLDLVGSFTKVSIVENGLVVTPFKKKETLLHYIGNGLFRAADRVSSSHYLYSDEKVKYMTTGLNTIKKINGWEIIFSWISFTLGILGVTTILIAGIYQIYREGKSFIRKPAFALFLGVLLLLFSITSITSKNIISVGDRNMGGILLYACSILLPLFSFISIILHLRKKIKNNPLNAICFWSAIFVLQFMAFLAHYGLVPFATWK